MGRIVVGVDGSEGSRAALRWAVEEAKLRQADVEAVMAWHDPYVASEWMGTIPLDTEALEASFRGELDDVVAGVDASGLARPIEKVMVQGGAAGALVDAAEGADLLVVGSRGRGGFVGLLLGSVSQQVVNHAPCPVVVVPTPR